MISPLSFPSSKTGSCEMLCSFIMRTTFPIVSVADTGWTLCGAVDDLWQARSGALIVADYKATARSEMPTSATLYGSYRRQMDVYQFLVRRQGFEVADRGWFVYTNGDGRAGRFGDTLCFTTALVPYDGHDGWVLEAFRRAVALVGQPASPPPGPDCEFCAYVAGASSTR